MKIKKTFWIFMGIFILLIGIKSPFCAYATNQSIGTVIITEDISKDSCMNEDMKKVRKRFIDAGFTHVKLKQKKTEDERINKQVFDITIGGNDSFSVGDQFETDALVILSFWVYIAPHASNTEHETMPTTTPVPEYGQTEADNDPDNMVYENPSAEMIMAVQQALNAAGFDCGIADGIAGEKTRSAIRSFKVSIGLSEDDSIDDNLLNALSISITDEYQIEVSQEANQDQDSIFDYAYCHRFNEYSIYLLIDVDNNIIVDFITNDRTRIVSTFTGNLNDGIDWGEQFHACWRYRDDPTTLMYFEYGSFTTEYSKIPVEDGVEYMYKYTDTETTY